MSWNCFHFKGLLLSAEDFIWIKNLEFFLSVCAGSRFSASPQSWCAGPTRRCTQRWPAHLMATKTQRPWYPDRQSRSRPCCPERRVVRNRTACRCTEFKKRVYDHFFLLLLLWNIMAAGCCEGTYNPFTTFISDYSDHLCYCFSLYAHFVLHNCKIIDFIYL